MLKIRDVLPGAGLPYPLYHALSGNLPVLDDSRSLHNPIINDAGEVISDFSLYTGNLDIVSKDLWFQKSNDLLPGWIPLVDHISKHTFWWNINHRSRRTTKPARTDDGRRGAGKGESDAEKAIKRNHKLRLWLQSLTWQELWDPNEKRRYYHNRITNMTQWTRPPDFAYNGLPYKSNWIEKLQYFRGSDSEVLTYVNTGTGEVVEQKPEDYDGLPHQLTDSILNRNSWSAAQGLTAEESEKLEAQRVLYDQSLGREPNSPPPKMPGFSIETVGEEEYYRIVAMNIERAEKNLQALNDLSFWFDGKDEDEILFGVQGENRAFPDKKGYLYKCGGGYSLFGRRNWKKRYFLSKDGFLCYFKNKKECDEHCCPLKGLKIPLHNYSVRNFLGDELRFSLFPTPEAHGSYIASRGQGVPNPDRIFEFRASSALEKREWMIALGGYTIDKSRESSGTLKAKKKIFMRMNSYVYRGME